MSFLPIANYSSYSYIPGFDVGNMFYFGPEVMMANNANRKKLIEQRSKTGKETGSSNQDKSKSINLGDYESLKYLFPGSETDTTSNDEGKGLFDDYTQGAKKDKDVTGFQEYMGMPIEQYIEMLEGFKQRGMAFGAGLGQLGAGISSIAYAPSLVGQSALQAAQDMGNVTIANMGAMAAQNRVMEANPTKTRFAGRYFR